MKTLPLSWLLTVWLLSSVSIRAATNLFPFVLPWDDASPGVTDLSGWLDKPVGKAGHIRIGEGAHFYSGDKRVRFMGVNLAFSAGMPAKEDGEKIAARMAKFGINVVRFHHMDTAAWPSGIREHAAKDSGHLDREAVDRMDYFIGQLKARGIYANINLLVGRPFNAGDGLPREIETMDAKDRHVVGFWDAKHLQLQKEYARRLLAHTNPYTGMSYTDDPAVAFVEINNESGLIHAWLGGNVDRYPDVFIRGLQTQWNAWLQKRYETSAKLRTAWDVGAQPLGAELLRNTHFTGQSGWALEKHDGAQASTAFQNGTVLIKVAKAGTESWHVQFGQRELAFEAGKAYTLSFRAKANEGRVISVAVSEAHGAYANLGLSANPALTNAWRTFRYVFNVSHGETNGRVSFANLGAAGSEVELADVSLRPGGVAGLTGSEELGSIPFFQKNTFGQRTAAAQRDWMSFLYDTEDAYWQAMYHFLKDDLKVKALVGGTIGGCSPLNIQAKMDWVDTHAYWQHPHFPRKQWDPGDWIVANKPMVNEKGGTLAGLALKRISGKPHAVTEYNHPAPNTYASEGFLLLAAYGALQDWDAIYAYCYAHTRGNTAAWDSRKINGFFDVDQHPTKMATWVTAAAMFLRGDVRAARGEVKASMPVDVERDLLRSAHAWSLVDAASVGLNREAPLMQRVSVSLENFQTPKFSFPRPVYESDTSELKWDLSTEGRGVVTVDAPQTKAVIGFGGGKTFRLGDVTIEPGDTLQRGWSTVSVMKKGQASYLVTATGEAENTGMIWKNAEKSSVGRDWGGAPSLVEGVPAKITFKVAGKTAVTAFALDARGQRQRSVPVQIANGQAILSVGPEWQTLWYEVLVK